MCIHVQIYNIYLYTVAKSSNTVRIAPFRDSSHKCRWIHSGRRAVTAARTLPQRATSRRLSSYARDVDVVVIGGGHAGCEAAAAAARRGAATLLITPSPGTSIGEMSCNPSIGGLAKGTLVREIDALDGLMGRVADEAGIQFRMLNASKGPAVRGPRAQMDRARYKAAMQRALRAVPGLEICDGSVVDLIMEPGGSARHAAGTPRVAGVRLADGAVVGARADRRS